MKNTKGINGKLKELKGKLKQKYADSTEEDLLYADDKQDQMVAKFKAKLSKSKEEFEKIMSEL